jgi:hypothetical protein
MYCTLVFVCLCISGLSLALLLPAKNPLIGTLTATVLFHASGPSMQHLLSCCFAFHPPSPAGYIGFTKAPIARAGEWT